MTIGQRRILYLSFFLLFFICSPLLILYATGYRLDPSTWRISKVGALYIKSYPAGARVYRNDQYTRRKTPTQIVNMPVGKQVISVIKDGYLPWRKTLRIEAGKTTFAEDIVLFKQSFDSKELGSGGLNFLVTPDGELAAYSTASSTLAIVNLTNASADIRGTLPMGTALKTWSQDKTRIAYQAKNLWSVIDANSQKNWNITNLTKLPISRIAFGPSSDDLWIVSNTALYRYNLITNKKSLVANAIMDIAIDNDSVMALTVDHQIMQLKTASNSQELIALPAGDYRSIADYRQGLLILAGSNQFTLWHDNTVVDKIAATNYDWRKNKILFTNGYDIWSFNTSDLTTTLLDRTSQQPRLLRWHPSQSYISEIIDNQLTIIELDNRGEKRHLIPVAEVSVGDYTFDPKGERLYILTPSSLREMQIQ